MAVIVPPFLPQKASQGEKRLFEILAQKLSDDFYIWYEPRINTRYPDFIILSPAFGLLILEVKGWYLNQILEATYERFKIKSDREDYSSVQMQKSPLRQGKDYLDLLLNDLQKYRILTQPAGEHQGKLAFPIGWGAIMSNITDEQATKINLQSVLPIPQVTYRNELLAWEKEDFSGEHLIKRLKQMFTVSFPFSPLTDDQISTIKGVIYPEFVIRAEKVNINSVASNFSLISSDVILRTLDAKQEALAKNIGEDIEFFLGLQVQEKLCS